MRVRVPFDPNALFDALEAAGECGDGGGPLAVRDLLRRWMTLENEARSAADVPPLTHRDVCLAMGMPNRPALAQILAGATLTDALFGALLLGLGLSPQGEEALFLAALRERERCHQALKRAQARDREEGGRMVAERTAEALRSAQGAFARAEAALRVQRDQVRARRIRGSLHEILTSALASTVVELMRCPGARPDPAWIAAQLRFPDPAEDLASALHCLEEAGVLTGPLSPLYFTDPDVEASRVRRYYEGVHRQSAAALRAHFGPDRAELQRQARLGALTVAIPASGMARWESLLVEVQNLIAARLMELEGPPDVVYQVFLHLFPLTAVVPPTEEIRGPDEAHTQSPGNECEVDPARKKA